MEHKQLKMWLEDCEDHYQVMARLIMRLVKEMREADLDPAGEQPDRKTLDGKKFVVGRDAEGFRCVDLNDDAVLETYLSWAIEETINNDEISAELGAECFDDFKR